MMTSVGASWYGPLRCRRVHFGVSGRAPKGVQGVCDHFTAVAGLLWPRGLVPTPAEAIFEQNKNIKKNRFHSRWD